LPDARRKFGTCCVTMLIKRCGKILFEVNDSRPSSETLPKRSTSAALPNSLLTAFLKITAI
jgi:hypothetical protein